MALSDQWTRAQFRTTVQTELMDPSAKWWTVAELNQYISDWQDQMQEKFEFVWGTATYGVPAGTATITFTAPPSILYPPGFSLQSEIINAPVTDILRLDAVYWDDFRLTPITKPRLEVLQRDWRQGTGVMTPQSVYQDDIRSMSFWPAPSFGGAFAIGTAVLEYPRLLSIPDDTTALPLPAWVRYSCIPYCLWRAYRRAGPNQDVQKAARFKKAFLRYILRYRTIWEQRWPMFAPSLRPGGKYEGDILNAGRNTTIFQTWY